MQKEYIKLTTDKYSDIILGKIYGSSDMADWFIFEIYGGTIPINTKYAEKCIAIPRYDTGVLGQAFIQFSDINNAIIYKKIEFLTKEELLSQYFIDLISW